MGVECLFQGLRVTSKNVVLMEPWFQNYCILQLLMVLKLLYFASTLALMLPKTTAFSRMPKLLYFEEIWVLMEPELLYFQRSFC